MKKNVAGLFQIEQGQRQLNWRRVILVGVLFFAMFGLPPAIIKYFFQSGTCAVYRMVGMGSYGLLSWTLAVRRMLASPDGSFRPNWRWLKCDLWECMAVILVIALNLAWMSADRKQSLQDYTVQVTDNINTIPGCKVTPSAAGLSVAAGPPSFGDADLSLLVRLAKGLDQFGRGINDLSLMNTQVTDQGLESLQELSDLRMLRLEGTQFTDAGLEHLKMMTSLEKLTLVRTRTTDEAGNRLQKALPNCRLITE